VDHDLIEKLRADKRELQEKIDTLTEHRTIRGYSRRMASMLKRRMLLWRNRVVRETTPLYLRVYFMPVTILLYDIRHFIPFRLIRLCTFKLSMSCLMPALSEVSFYECAVCFKDCLYACVVGRKLYSLRTYLQV
jgi:hypothetical protein